MLLNTKTTNQTVDRCTLIELDESIIESKVVEKVKNLFYIDIFSTDVELVNCGLDSLGLVNLLIDLEADFGLDTSALERFVSSNYNLRVLVDECCYAYSNRERC